MDGVGFLSQYRKSGFNSLLGIGPMSRNCVDVTIELARETRSPLFLVASRRQVECEKFGGGYVNDWTTEGFAQYVEKIKGDAPVFLCRDHGGPWQNFREVRSEMNLLDAMESAKQSFTADIESGFRFLHIDPSVELYGKPTRKQVLKRILELYDHCMVVSRKLKKEIFFEIGAESQDGEFHSPEQLEYFLSSIAKFCEEKQYPMPTFAVVQTGTKVMETRNIGRFQETFSEKETIDPDLAKCFEICSKYGVWIKEHNSDYLDDQMLALRPKIGIHAANIAPEFAIIETRGILRLLDQLNLSEQKDDFIQLALESQMWKKWVIPESKLSSVEKATLAGHYIYSTTQFKKIRSDIQERLSEKGQEIDTVLKVSIRESIYRIMKLFNLV